MEQRRVAKMRIALAQMDIQWEDKEINKIKCEEMIARAYEQQADCIIFPEMTLTGFSMNVNEIAESELSSLTLLFFKKMSRKYNITIIFGYVARYGEIFQNNCALVVGGRQLLSYTKRRSFLLGKEQEHYQAGNIGASVCLDGVCIGTYICFDLRFPELFVEECQTLHGAVVIANWPMERIEQWKILLQARAIENQCYMIGVNRVGVGDQISYGGCSMIVNPYGKILNKENMSEDLILGELDPYLVEECRKDFPMR